MLRYATIEEAWQRSTPPVRRTYPADQGQHTTPPEILDPPAEAPAEYAEYDRLEGQRPDVLPDHVAQSAPVAAPQPDFVQHRECVETGMYDVMLYAIAGVVLVLILEQFVQMGIKMGA
jgi:hypothetical protein